MIVSHLSILKEKKQNKIPKTLSMKKPNKTISQGKAKVSLHVKIF